MRSFLKTGVFLAVMSFLALGAMAQVRGTGRLQGNVFDKNSGKPIEGATITVAFARENTKPIVVKSDKRGHWGALGLVSGQWNIDVSAPGYETSRGTANVSEIQMLPAIRTELVPAQAQEAAPVTQSPLIPKEAVDLINEGQTVLHAATTSSDEATTNAKTAVADFEKALPLIPTDKPEALSIRNQLMEVMAQAYYKSGDLKKAISTLEQLNTTDPWTAADARQTQRELLLSNLYLENGDLDKGKALIEKLPAGTVTDPTVFVNMGILLLNKKNPADSVTYFTKAMELDPKSVDAYYYRGLAYMQQRQTKEAKPDLEKVIALAPDSEQARDARQLLAGVK